MHKILMTTIAATALIAGASLASAQGMSQPNEPAKASTGDKVNDGKTNPQTGATGTQMNSPSATDKKIENPARAETGSKVNDAKANPNAMGTSNQSDTPAADRAQAQNPAAASTGSKVNDGKAPAGAPTGTR